MGTKAATVVIGVRQNVNTQRSIDNPYTHLAVSIILQAYEDLKALHGAERGYVQQSLVTKWEIINFLRSKWCGLLLSCQDAVTQEQVESAAWSILEN